MGVTMLFKKQIKISSFQIIIGSFLAIILGGTLLLMLPFSSLEHVSTSFGDALFTATSAVCVTGLVVRDTASYWSLFGRAVILVMIQIGGMGTITLAMFVTHLSGRKLTLFERSVLKDAVSSDQFDGLVHFTMFLLSGTLTAELLGALLLLPVFLRDHALSVSVGYAVFHSVSAFCNAGFDLMGRAAPYSSLTGFTGNTLMNLTIMSLIVVGGIGFRTWEDIGRNKRKVHKYRLQTKLILTTTLILIVVPAVLFFFIEYNALPIKERILASFFQSVTTRTAGFNTTDYNNFSGTGVVMTIILMLIGGAPGSTAGGMKITTITILFLTMLAFFKREKSPAIFKRRIPTEAIYGAVAVCMLDVMLAVLGSMSIARIEHRAFLTALFESASAVGTVGLSMGITPTLHTVSKFILIILMYTGRVGGLTLVFAAITRKSTGNRQYPADNIAVG